MQAKLSFRFWQDFF